MEEKLFDNLFKKYNILLLTRHQTLEILGISTSTSDRLKEKGMGPKFQKIEKVSNSAVRYAITEIINYIFGNNNETFN